MPFFVAISILSLAITVILYRTYVGYGEYSWLLKGTFLTLLVLGSLAPFITHYVREKYSFSGLEYIVKTLYFLFGFIFFLFAMSIIRDIVWFLGDLICRVPLEQMKNTALLQKVNIITLIVCLSVCFYGLYEAESDAEIVTHEIASSKIKKPAKVVMLSDLHIDVDVSPKYVENLVKRVNNLKPDVIVMTGDIIDNFPKSIYKQTEELSKLKAQSGIYVSLGNHEGYIDNLGWVIKFAEMGFQPLANYGERLPEYGLYIGGIPDINAAKFTKPNVDVNTALYFSKKEDYVIMLSHTPIIAPGINKDNVDLQLSGHTHGGQIYPFHYMAKKANDGHLAGFYDVDGVKLYVSRGTRYWGPSMRILAPSEITVFNFKPEKNDK